MKLSTIALLTIIPSLVVAGCQNGWIPFEEHCYYIIRQKMTWWSAKKFCNDNGGYLARIDSSSENEWLKTQSRASRIEYSWSPDFWVGGTDEGHEGTWIWESDNKEISTDFRDFSPGQPDNWDGRENCLALISNEYRWGDAECFTKDYGFCEKNK